MNDRENDLKKDIDIRIEELTSIATYFTLIQNTCKRDIKVLTRFPKTVKNMKEILNLTKTQLEGDIRLGHFGTNVNENLWSQIRHKSKQFTSSSLI